MKQEILQRLFPGRIIADTIPCNISTLGEIDKTAMVERHIISPLLAKKEQTTGLILSEDETVSIMLNGRGPYKNTGNCWWYEFGTGISGGRPYR